MDFETLRQNPLVMSILVPLGTFLLTVAAGVALRNILFTRLTRWARNSSTHIDDIVIDATRSPFLIWCIMLGIYLALAISALPESVVRVSGKTLFALGIVSFTLAAANISSRMVKVYASRIESALPVTSLTQHITRIVIFVVGGLIILNTMGISITPILATLGVGGLAVALALQDTLSNLFAGFYVIASRQIMVGQFVRLESGEEGYVTDISWRTTRIRMLPNNEVLIPNERLIKSVITNYYMPDKELSVLVEVGVHYGSDLDKVEKVTSEVAKEVMRDVQGGIPAFDPFIRYHTFAGFAINFSVILRAKEFVDQYLIKHEFIKRLHRRYAREGIVIPYPIRAINYAQEKAGS